MIVTIFAGVIFAVIGIFIFLKPDVIWNLTEKWKSYRADEPSELYLKSTKFGGVLEFREHEVRRNSCLIPICRATHLYY